ncbi:MAG TPA: restriction endonuclease [Tepidisphaeraceae bacterium]|nr:restriction endonuclease [Tepidisphaeraceae bacterium]
MNPNNRPTPIPFIDAGAAEKQLADALVAQKTASKNRAAANRNVLLRQAKLRAARLRIVPWIAALAAGSACALVLCATMALAGAGLALILLTLMASYVVAGGGVYRVLGDFDGENGETRIAVRSEMLDLARQCRAESTAALMARKTQTATARSGLDAAQRITATAEYQYQRKAEELLAIDVGRLYPDEFERYVGSIFTHLGYTVEQTGKSHDQGVDVIASRGTIRIAVQAKRHIGAVGNAAIQEVYAGMAHYGCHHCMVVASGDFTSGAISLAQSTRCVLVGKAELPALIRGEKGI